MAARWITAGLNRLLEALDMSRKYSKLFCAVAVALTHISLSYADVLPEGSALPAIRLKHFPDRLHAFVWRNWELASLDRMAKVLETKEEVA
jgi:hypothetical protein